MESIALRIRTQGGKEGALVLTGRFWSSFLQLIELKLKRPSPYIVTSTKEIFSNFPETKFHHADINFIGITLICLNFKKRASIALAPFITFKGHYGEKSYLYFCAAVRQGCNSAATFLANHKLE